MVFPLHPHRAFIIAEAGVNHDGKTEQALALIDAAAEAGADAVKFQMFDADELTAADAPLAAYQERSGEKNQRDMLRRLTLPREEYRILQERAAQKKIAFIVTPFDAKSAQFLASIGVQILKIGSGEITNLPFLRAVAALHIPTILSTGMSSMQEIAEAVEPFLQTKTPYALLHCVSAYPAPVDQINLRAMQSMRQTFSVPVGYSDHTLGMEVALAAVAHGAEILEKHLTLDATLSGPDHAASLEPAAFASMVRGIRMTEVAGGSAEKICQPCEEQTRAVVRRSIVLAVDALAGAVLTEEMLTLKRPGTGMPPQMMSQIVGARLARPVSAGTLLTSDMFL